MAHVSIPAVGRLPEPRNIALLQHVRLMSKTADSLESREHIGQGRAVAPGVRAAYDTRSLRLGLAELQPH